MTKYYIEGYNCPLTEVSKKLLVALDNEDVKFEIGGSFHFILGGHAKLVFNSTKFFKSMFEGVEDE